MNFVGLVSTLKVVAVGYHYYFHFHFHFIM